MRIRCCWTPGIDFWRLSWPKAVVRSKMLCAGCCKTSSMAREMSNEKTKEKDNWKKTWIIEENQLIESFECWRNGRRLLLSAGRTMRNSRQPAINVSECTMTALLIVGGRDGHVKWVFRVLRAQDAKDCARSKRSGRPCSASGSNKPNREVLWTTSDPYWIIIAKWLVTDNNRWINDW